MGKLLWVIMAVGLTGCAARKIPGTEIDDTSDTRAVLDVVNQYRSALEARNAQGIIDLVDESFRDNAGSNSPEDDLDYSRLYTQLPAWLQRLDEVRVDMSVRKIEFSENQRQAVVTYTWHASFRMPQLSAKPRNETDIKQMTLVRGPSRWKISSGI